MLLMETKCPLNINVSNDIKPVHEPAVASLFLKLHQNADEEDKKKSQHKFVLFPTFWLITPMHLAKLQNASA